MGSHSKKRKKDRRRSRSHSSERHGSKSKHRSKSRSRSRTPSYRASSSKHKKHHKKSRSRSRSRSRERHSHSRRSSRSRSRSRERSRSRDKSSTSRRRRSRSRSLSRRSRSRSTERRRKRSRSPDRSSRSKRSRSRDRQKSPERSSARSSTGESQEKSSKVKNEKDSDEADDSSAHLNPAEAIHQKMRKALEAAASADAKLREQGLLSSDRQELLSRTEQLERDQKLQNLENESFTQSTFVPSRDRQAAQPTSYLTQDQTHENAIFGGVGVPNPAMNGGTQMYSYGIPMTYKKRGQLASKYLSESQEVKENRWLEKLQAMRRQKLEANPDYFNKLLTMNSDSPSRE